MISYSLSVIVLCKVKCAYLPINTALPSAAIVVQYLYRHSLPHIHPKSKRSYAQTVFCLQVSTKAIVIKSRESYYI